MQSAELTEFYRAYAKWLDEGAPHNAPFSRGMGLCGNREFYSTLIPRKELDKQFIETGYEPIGDIYIPFNKSLTDYDIEGMNKRCHLNPQRIKWVRDHCDV